MFTVTGTIESVPYQVGVHDEPLDDQLYGCVMGSTHATALLAANEGEEVTETPTHDPVTLSLTDPKTVLAFLRARTNVTNVEGDVPTTNPDDDEPVDGVLY